MNKQHFCPVCGVQIIPKHYSNIYKMIKNNSCCQKCGYKRRKSYKGENNPFYGKHHSIVSKEKKARNTDYGVYKTEEFKSKMAKVTSGFKNGMYGKSLHDIWLEKYGEEEANNRMEKLREKRRINATGVNNPMFGKIPGVGAGNGWGGWYKGWYFRSLCELSYMINIIEKNNFKWQSAESKKMAIQYDIDGVTKNYFADFIIEDRILVEVKPIELHNSKIVLEKKKAAIDYCAANGYEYQIISPQMLSNDEIISLHSSGMIRFTDSTEKKYQEKYS